VKKLVDEVDKYAKICYILITLFITDDRLTPYRCGEESPNSHPLIFSTNWH